MFAARSAPRSRWQLLHPLGQEALPSQDSDQLPPGKAASPEAGPAAERVGRSSGLPRLVQAEQQPVARLITGVIFLLGEVAERGGDLLGVAGI